MNWPATSKPSSLSRTRRVASPARLAALTIRAGSSVDRVGAACTGEPRLLGHCFFEREIFEHDAVSLLQLISTRSAALESKSAAQSYYALARVRRCAARFLQRAGALVRAACMDATETGSRWTADANAVPVQERSEIR